MGQRRDQQNKNSGNDIQWGAWFNYIGIKEAGFDDKTDFTDWAIIYYISHWVDYSDDIRVRDGRIYVWFSYRHLMRGVPLMKLTTKFSVWARLKKLRELGLIDSFLEPGNKLYVALTDKAKQIIRFKKYPSAQKNKEVELPEDAGQEAATTEKKDATEQAPDNILQEVRGNIARKQEERQERKLKKRRVTLSLPDKGTNGDGRMNEVLATDVIRQIYEKNWERMYPDSGCPLWEAKEIKVVKTLIRKLGSAQRAITLIEYVFDEWENLKRKWNKEGAPTIEIIATYGVGLIGEAEKWQKGRDEFRQIKWEEVQV